MDVFCQNSMHMQHFPEPPFPKTRAQIAIEYELSAKVLRRKLKEAKIKLPPGQILVKDQKRIYRALGPPSYLWIDKSTLVPYSEHLKFW
jgi:hypothetical protein